jgi:DNA polymerase-3 subunit epsilon
VPLFLRKALRVGPLRFNLSKSGIGVSAGVPGLRFGLVGPRGNYVYAGRYGLYYRKTLGSTHTPGASPSLAPTTHGLPDPSQPLLEDVAGATVIEMTSSSTSDLVQQLGEAARAPSLWGWVAAVGGVASIAAFSWVGLSGILVVAVTVAATWWLRQRDLIRRAVVVFYDVTDHYAQNFDVLINQFGWLSGSQRNVRLVASGAAVGYQKKVNAGAAQINRIIPVATGVAGPPQLTTNVSVPSLEDSQNGVYFLPDRLLVRQGKDFADVPYDQLVVTPGQTRWIEAESVPTDARPVGTTWQYVNVSGGPDQRFKNNRQLPILLLSTLRLSSASGLDSTYRFSNPDSAGHFASALAGMKHLNRQGDN